MRKIQPLAAIALDAERPAFEGRLNKDLPHPPRDATRPVESRRPYDGIGQSENLVIGDDELFPAELQRSIDADRLEGMILAYGLGLEISVDHARGEKDEALQPRIPSPVKGVLERTQAVVKGRKGGFIRAPGMGHRGQVHHHIGSNRVENPRERVVIAGILRIELDGGSAQELEPLTEHSEIEFAVRNFL